MLGFGVSLMNFLFFFFYPLVEKAVSRKIGISSLSWEQPPRGFSKSLLKNHLQRDWEMKRHFPAHEEICNQRFFFCAAIDASKITFTGAPVFNVSGWKNKQEWAKTNRVEFSDAQLPCKGPLWLNWIHSVLKK